MADSAWIAQLVEYGLVRDLMPRMRDSVAAAIEATTRIHGYVEEYEKVSVQEEGAMRALTLSPRWAAAA